MYNIEKVLKDSFGLESFRDGQQATIESILAGTDTLVFMPTGGWKSLTYQLPGVCMDGLTLVISPLISLMKDQVDKLNELWIRVELINSTISFGEQQNILNELSSIWEHTENPIKFLYIAPERLNSEWFLRVLRKLKISLVAIDEAHCISQWWHDFRPSYMKIKGFLDNLKETQSFPIVALTATATKKVRADMVERLGLHDYNMFTKWFDRKNIIILVREISKKEEKIDKVWEILEKTPGSWIIYCSSRKVTKEVYDDLLKKWVKCGIYTGAMTPEKREEMQNGFMTWELKVIVATNAFWMWIDKKDIRFVIHYNLPGSIENYYQEVWRAGRDDKKSFGVVLASYGDTKIQEFFIENTYPEKEEILNFYDYLYRGYDHGWWQGQEIQKTYMTMASESGLKNDYKAGSILKILEKYWVLRKGVQWEVEEWFRGRWITLLQEKRKHSELLIDWNHQNKLKDEAYYKLDQIKKLLFYPSCRKRFILDYFGDEEDLKNLWDDCGSCDYCLEKKDLQAWKLENLVHLSTFGIVLDVISRFNNKFGMKLIANLLRGSREKRILDWWLDKSDDYGVLSEYSSELVEAVLEWLIKEEFLEQTSWKFPLIRLTDLGEVWLKKEKILKESEPELQEYLHMKVKSNAFKSKPTWKSIKKSWEGKQTGNYDLTLKLFKEWKDLKTIAKEMDFKIMTIENHILKLYERGDLGLMDMINLLDLDNLKEVKKVIEEFFWANRDKLKPIKEKLEELWFPLVSYFEIKGALVMMEKRDL